ncbi:MAG: hypothetical protein ABSD74_11625 [Rhizomicrobium sp.]|jgi:hypothetical protein
MTMLRLTALQSANAGSAVGQKFAMRDNLPGWIGSFTLHLLLALLLFALVRHPSQPPVPAARLVPVNVISLGDKTQSPEQSFKMQFPQLRAAVRETHQRRTASAAPPVKNAPPPNALDAQLRALAHMRAPATDLPALDNAGASNADATSDDATRSASASYSIRDYIRNQVERRWNLNVARLRGRNYVIELHIELRRNGIIDKVDVVDRSRFVTDAAFRDVALSARNAVLLSSPIALPSGQLQMPMEITLLLNPRDTLR